MSWSGGKDSALSLHQLQYDSRYEVVGLMTTNSGEFRRVSHRGVREELLEHQAAAIGLPLRKLYFAGHGAGSESATMEDFDRCMVDVCDGSCAVITCVEPVAAKLTGTELSSSLLGAEWPRGVDPCGEHGENHSFVCDRPIFAHPIAFVRGPPIVRDGRYYTDLLATPISFGTPHAQST
jgi:diphthamide synthase (EF-2-diphthine--ammonia ligase)